MLLKWLYRGAVALIIFLTIVILARLTTDCEKHALQTATDTESRAVKLEAQADSIEATYTEAHQ
jgi:hypothetical protein